MKTDITIVLDRSASMHSVCEETIAGFNKFLADRKTQENAIVTLNQFDNEFETVFNAFPVAEIPELNAERFVPRGSTALLDAIGRSINQAEARFKESCPSCSPIQKIFVIITDGEENSSVEFNNTQINAMISKKRSEGWEFVFLGANQDAIATATRISIPTGNALSYAGTKVGTRKAFESVSRGMTSYSASNAINTNSFFDQNDRDAQDEEMSDSGD